MKARRQSQLSFLFEDVDASCSLAGGLETAGNLEGVVDPPLETGQGTNHEDTGAEASPEAVETDSAVDFADGAALLVHDGDHGVSGVRNDSAENTSPVAGHESDHKLEVLRVSVTRSSEHVAVQETDSSLEGDELHDGVGDLSAPERHDTLVEERPAALIHHLGETFAESLGESALVSSLDSDFDLNKRSLISNLFKARRVRLTASKGQRAMSAMNSAQAEETAKPTVWYLAAFSGPTAALYTSLNIS
jgi:hypothetical protein